MDWSPTETNTHQDHVIAHVVGATVLGYFIIDEALHLLLDMGFIWTVYLDGEMALLPQRVAIDDLETTAETKQQLSADIELLLKQGPSVEGPEGLTLVTNAPCECLIKEVSLFAQGDNRKLLIVGEEENLVVETSSPLAEFVVTKHKGT
jgi:hypothetical protein